VKPLVCLYCEGTDAKLAVLSGNKGNIKVHRVAAITLSRALQSFSSKQAALAELEGRSSSDELSFDSLDSAGASEAHIDQSDVGLFYAALHDLKIKNMLYLPIVTEPTVNYHQYDGPRDANKKKLIRSVITDLINSKGISVENDSIDVIELNNKSMLALFIEGEIPSVGLINQLANYVHRRFLKIPTIKTAELSLSYYVSKATKFFPEDYSLIIYIGKEYSKLIFLEGQRLKHIGSTMDIGTNNLHTYDVYFSKILLEMENGGIPKLDNIILCGEDRSENLILSFYGTFPEANVSELKFDNFDTANLSEEDAKNLALYSIPIAAAVDYFDELDKTHVGINFLPRYIHENQKSLQFGWHSYVILPILFGAAFFFTFHGFSNQRQIKDLDFEIERLNQQQIENQTLVEQIKPLELRINSFDATQTILDTVSLGAGVWNKAISRISDFSERRRNFWITKFEPINKNEIKLTGFSLSRSIITEFVDLNKGSVLKNINYDPLREKSAFSFVINFKLTQDTTSAK
jgi:hypothetical protein